MPRCTRGVEVRTELVEQPPRVRGLLCFARWSGRCVKGWDVLVVDGDDGGAPGSGARDGHDGVRGGYPFREPHGVELGHKRPNGRLG
jgi:hypothetical protein